MQLYTTKFILMLMLVIMHLKPVHAVKSANDLYQTNDKELNKILLQIDAFGIKYPSDFSDVFAKISGEDRQVFLSYFKSKRYKPADISMSIGLGKVTNKSGKVILRQFSAHKGMGWAMIGTMHGLKSGSKRYTAWVDSQKAHLFALESYRKKKIEAARPKKPASTTKGKREATGKSEEAETDKATEKASETKNAKTQKDAKKAINDKNSKIKVQSRSEEKNDSKAVSNTDVKTVVKEETK